MKARRLPIFFLWLLEVLELELVPDVLDIDINVDVSTDLELDIAPDIAPDVAPALDVAPETALDVALDEVLDDALDEALDEAPNIVLDVVLDKAMELEPDLSPNLVLAMALIMVLQLAPEVAPNIVLDEALDKVLDVALEDDEKGVDWNPNLDLNQDMGWFSLLLAADVVGAKEISIWASSHEEISSKKAGCLNAIALNFVIFYWLIASKNGMRCVLTCHEPT